MLPAYKMIIVNIVLSAFLLSGLIIYKYILKRKINLLYLLILVSTLPIISIFRLGSYESGDLSLHTTRLMSFYNLLINYRLIPRWTPEFNAGYGDPHFLFAYFLPYFIGSIFHFIGLSFLGSIKLLLASSFVVSGITMFFWVKEELGKKAGFAAAIFYLFMPYHLVDMHFRVTIAENLSFVFLPFILLAIKKIVEKNNKRWFFVLSLSLALLMLSHQVISMMFFPIMLSYSIFVWFRKRNKTIKSLIYCFSSMFFGLFISSFYWLPIVFLAKFTQQGSNPTPIFFPEPLQLLYSPWRLGFLFQGHKGELSYLIGYTQLFVVGLSVYLIIKKNLDKKLKSLLLFFLIIFAILIFMTLPISKPIWENTAFLKYSQFSTRILVFLTLCISIITGIITKKIHKNWFIVSICFLTISYTILNWGNRRAIPAINDNYLKKEFNIKPDISGLEPSSPIWANLKKSQLRIKSKASIEVISGNALIKETTRTPIDHRYQIKAYSDIEVKENTLFFPGWVVLINGNTHAINYKNSNYPGVITFKLNKGIYNVNIKFIDIPIIIFSKWLSLISIVALIVYPFITKKLLRFILPKF